jgi:hypothetical protein
MQKNPLLAFLAVLAGLGAAGLTVATAVVVYVNLTNDIHRHDPYETLAWCFGVASVLIWGTAVSLAHAAYGQDYD